MKLRPISPREKAILYITIGVIIIGVSGHFVIGPAIDSLSEVNKEIEKKTYLLKKQTSLLKRGGDITSLYESYRKTLEKQRTPQEIVASLFKDIEAAAKKTGLKLKKVKPLPVKEGKEYKEVLLELDIEGDFVAFFKFINELETKTSFVKISALRLTSQSSSSKALRCRLSLSKIFF